MPTKHLQQVINYRFTDERLLEAALRHRSLGSIHNERLEFLGDSVLGMVVAQTLFQQYPDASEGELTRLRAQLVRQETLATVSRRLDLGRALQLGPAAGRSGGADRSSILADGLFYCYGDDSRVALVQMSPKGRKVISKFKITKGGGDHWARLAISDGRLYVRHGDALIVYDIKDPKATAK